jgi:fibronectin-binding autotransporter adhesin
MSDNSNLFGITKAGAGTLVLTGANTFSGTTSITGGVLSVNSLANGGLASTLGASSASPTSLLFSGNGILRYTGSTAATTDRLFSVGITGGRIESSGTGTLSFSSNGSIAQPDVAPRGASRTEDSAIVTAIDTTGLTVGMAVSGDGIPPGAVIASVDVSGINGQITLSLPAGTTTVDPLAELLTFSTARTLTLAGVNEGANTFAPVLEGAFSLVKAGSGNWELTGNNTFVGSTTIEEGSLTVSSLNTANGSAPSSSLGVPSSLAASVIKLGSGSLTGGLIYNGAGQTTDRVFELVGTTGGGFIHSSGSGSLVITSNLLVSGAGVKSFTLGGTNTGDNAFNGVIGGGANLSLVKTGSGTWSAGGANTFAGTTTIQDGTLVASSLNRVSGGTASSSLGAPTNVGAGTIALGQGALTGTLRYVGAGESTDRVINLAGTTGGGSVEASGTGALNMEGNVTATGVGAKTFTLGGSSTAANRLSGIISNAPISLVKAGEGSWIISGANQYTGTTTVNAGVLQVGQAGAGRTGTGATTVNGGVLAGSGTIDGTANVTNHTIGALGAVRPGDNAGAAIGTLTFNGNLLVSSGASMTFGVASRTLNDGNILGQLASGSYEGDGGYSTLSSTFNLWNNTAVPGGAHDLLNINGTLTLGSALITITDNGYFSGAQFGDILDLGDWGYDSVGSSFAVGTNYRNGGTGGGNLLLPTLPGNLVYDVSQFATSGVLAILTAPQGIPVRISSYIATGSGSWNQATNWRAQTSPATPNTPASIAALTSNISSISNIALDGDKLVGKMVIGDANNTHNFNIVAGTGGSLQMNNGNFGRALISKTQSNSTTVGVDVINVPVQLQSGLNINVNSGGAAARLDISGPISETGGSRELAIMGAGRVTFSGTSANTYTGDTRVYSRGFGDATNPQLVLAKAPSRFGGLTGGTALQLSTTVGSSAATISGDVTSLLAAGMPLSGNTNLNTVTTITTVSYNELNNTTTIGLSAAASGTSSNVSTSYGSFLTTHLQQGYTANTTSGNATVTLTGGGTTTGFFVGMPVSGTGIPAGAIVTSINANGTQFNISANASANGTGVAVTANTGSTAASTNTTAGMYVGMPVSGPGIPANATVASILSPTSFTINSAITTAGVRQTTFGSAVANGAVTSSNLFIGNVSLGGLGSTVVHLGGSEQIANNTVLRFDGGNGLAATGNGGNNPYFKLMGFDETVGGLSDFTASGVIENSEGEAISRTGTLTLQTAAGKEYSFNGFLRDRQRHAVPFSGEYQLLWRHHDHQWCPLESPHDQ